MTDALVSLPGTAGAVMIRRDAYGVPHIHAHDERDGWFGMGFAAAQDRLWQMEYDRRRGSGRWAEVIGPVGLKSDVLARRLRLVDAAHEDISVMDDATRSMFESYTAGVNAFIATGELPPEYALMTMGAQPWTIEDSIVAFKIRHVLMGPWQLKLVQAIVAARAGLASLKAMVIHPPQGSLVTLPPGHRLERLYEDAEEDLAEAAAQLGFVSEVEAGSNAWVVASSRTTTGRPVLCNDSHRALDVPNVYWQARIEWPGVDVVGATFAGLPGFPHFGFNGRVGWAITHTMADYQDLYIEEFDASLRHRTPDGWRASDRRIETIAVRGAAPVEIETFRTRHGPLVHGDPRGGNALALRYTGTDTACETFNVFRPMLFVRNVDDLFDTQRDWVDPVNNLVAADVDGHIGYLTRGRLPIRSSRAHERLPVVGWTDEHEWVGVVPFERMPRAIDPELGFVVTSNQAVVDADDPYITHSFHDPFRAERIAERLTMTDRLSPSEIADIQSDTTSWVAKYWIRYLRGLGSLEGDAGLALSVLAAWDADLAPGSGAALLYACFRRCATRIMFEPIVGVGVWQWLTSTKVPAASLFLRRAFATHFWNELVREPPTADRTLRDAVPEALGQAWRAAIALAGPDPRRWRWDECHRTRSSHPLSLLFPQQAQSLDPPSIGVGGDSDTPQTASYGFSEAERFDITSLSVYRQVLDFADLPHASFVVPGGVSGVPGSPHYTDQLELWRTHRRIPMLGVEAREEQRATQRPKRAEATSAG